VGGQVFDLEVAGGKLFAADMGSDSVHRFALGAALGAPEASVALPAGSAPKGLTSDGVGNLWVTEYNTGAIDRLAVAGGAPQRFVPPAGALTGPFGIVAGVDGNIYAAGESSANVARLSPGSGAFAFYPRPGLQPKQVINGVDGDPVITDNVHNPLLRLVNSAPRPATGAAAATGPTSASAAATVNPRGNETQVVFDYGPTTAYGATSPPIAVPNGADAVALTGVLTDLTPSTTYHVRVRATNAEGTTTGADTTLTTPKGDADGDGVAVPADCNDANPAIHPGAVDKPGDKIDQDCSGADATFPELTATTNFTYRFFRTGTVVAKIEISRLKGGESAKIRCTGRGCPFTVKSYTKLKKGKRAFGRKLLRKRKLAVGTTVSMRVTKKGYVGTSTVLTVRRAKPPRIARKCLQPGAKKPTTCP
jgi:hypothetical protein